ncbi:hypothetical protein LCGC14_2232110 [marine sediment metagenome]|uniref:Uncharacterized protein n=1 Tax=marine sediment metagenome TaxID=412755 RepID=A0A0F9FKI8_9ZZZZ
MCGVPGFERFGVVRIIKILTIMYRWITQRCVFCGNKKKPYPYLYGGILYCCPIDREDVYYNNGVNGCYVSTTFIGYKEAKVQRALGLLPGPEGF